MLKKILNRWFEIALDLMIVGIAYLAFGWIGFAISGLAIVLYFLHQSLEAQQTTMNTLLSRLPDRCAVCHREILDEGGVFDEEGIYHTSCASKLEERREQDSVKS
jgi:hypothetical protein